MVIGKLNHSANKPPRLVLYSKTIKIMKYVLVDLTRYQDKCGFGEIANNVGEHLKYGIINDIHFTILVLEKYKGVLGDEKASCNTGTEQNTGSFLQNALCSL